MAELVLINPYVAVGASSPGTDLSAYAKKATINYTFESLDKTVGSAYSARQIKAGLKATSIDVEFRQDFAAAALDSVLWPLVGTEVFVEVRPGQGSRSTSNPGYGPTTNGTDFTTGTPKMVFLDYTPLDTAVGELVFTTVHFEQAVGYVTRLTV